MARDPEREQHQTPPRRAPKPESDAARDRRRGRTQPHTPSPPPKRQGASANANGYYFPVSGNYRVSQKFHNRSARYKSGYHQGLDIAIPVGTPVMAVRGGTVIFVGPAGAHGQRVGIKAEDGNVYWYGHLSRFNVRPGDRVQAGSTVAWSGNTGQSTGPHLHLQVERAGAPIDPAPLIFGSNTRYAAGQTEGGYTVAGYANGSGQALEARLRSAEFPFPFDVRPFIEEALQLFGSDTASAFDYAYARILASPEFDRYYPGIKRLDGTLVMTPAQYTAYTQAVVSTAAEYGFNLTPAQIGSLVNRGVSPDEFTTRAQAIHTITTRPEILTNLSTQIQHMNAQRRKLGLPPIAGVNTVAEGVAFLTGQADRDVYDAYEAAQLQGVAQAAGIKINPERARELAKQTVGVLSLEETEQAYQQIASLGRQAGAQLYQFGYTQRDLETLQFGGRNRGIIAQGVSQALAQAGAAQNAEQAPENVAVTQTGQPVVARQRTAGL